MRYVEQLRRYRDGCSAPEQVLVLIYDDFRADNEATVRQVLRFLEVDDTVEVEVTEANPDRRRALAAARRPRALDQRRRWAALRAWQARRQGGRPEAAAACGACARCSGVLCIGEPEAPDEQLMGELRARFKPEVVALSEYLDRDLVTLWGYDGFG